MLHVLDWYQWDRKHGGPWGQMPQYICQRPREAPLYITHIPFTELKFRACFVGRVLKTPSGHERVGMMEGAQISYPYQGALECIASPEASSLLRKLNTNSVLRVYPWVNISHVSECSLYKLYRAQSFQIFEIG